MALARTRSVALVLGAAALFFTATCNRPSDGSSQISIAVSNASISLTPGQSIDIVVTLHSSAALDAPVIMTARSPGDMPLPDGIGADFTPTAFSLPADQDVTTTLHLVAQPQIADDQYPLVVYARSQDQEADGALNVTVAGTSTTWRRPIRTSGTDQVQAMGADHAGGVYVGVNTTGALAGLTNQGDLDGYVMHYRQNGAVSFVTPFATISSDLVTAIAVDDNDAVYVAGFTYGTFPGQFTAGKADGFIAKLSSEGNLAWLKQIGTSEIDQLTSIAVATDGSIYAGGLTEGAFPGQTNAGGSDVFIVKLSADGSQVWVRQFGTDQDERTNGVTNTAGVGITVDANGEVYACGSTQGTFTGAAALGLGDAFMTRLHSDGQQVWLQQFGSFGDDALLSMVAHSNGIVYAAGWAKGPFAGQVQLGGQDGVLVGFRSDGTRSLVRQFGTSYSDVINAIGLQNDKLYLAGSTRGSFPGQLQVGVQDFFLMQMSPEGTIQSLRQFGTSQSDSGTAVAGFGNNLYVGGITFGDFDTDAALSESDGFLFQYDATK